MLPAESFRKEYTEYALIFLPGNVFPLPWLITYKLDLKICDLAVND